MSIIAIFVALVFVYSLASRRLERTVVTAPMLFTAAGMLTYHNLSASQFMPWLPGRETSQGLFLHIAEIGLVLLLFTDAIRTDCRVLNRIRNLPTRLLSAGMLLTIVLGALAAKAVFPQLTLWEAGILSAILAPTDAGLGQIIVNSERVPLRIRQALNVEAGLNDGLSVPFLLFFFTMAEARAEGARASLTQFIVEQLGYGALIGGGIGLAGGWLLNFARRKEWMAGALLPLGVVTLPLLCLLASEAAGASMFIAAFVAGLAMQAGFKQTGKHEVEFTDEWGQLVNLAVFFLFGMVAACDWTQFTWKYWLYAVLSLTAVRMLPVAVSLLGSRLSPATVLFMGWFGPRGLASIVLGLVYLEMETRLPGEETIRVTVMVTVWLSILAHGVSALPGMNFYAENIKALPADAPEHQQLETNSAAGK